MKTAQSLQFTGFEYREGAFTFHFEIDGTEQVITLSHSSRSIFPESVIRSIGFVIGMCYLLDLVEIVVPTEVKVFASLTEVQVNFWRQLWQDTAKERMFETKMDLERLFIQWTADPDGEVFEKFKIDSQNDAVAICLTGGKESLAVLKLLEGKKSLVLFYLNLEKNVHRHRVHDVLEHTFPSIRTFSNRSEVLKPLTVEYGPLSSGVDMAHLVANTLLFADQYNSVLIGNEYSSNFPNGIYQGYSYNHQFVKTIDFARRVNDYLHTFVTEDFSYYSPFFSLYEYRIADIFFADDRYFELWTSCNRTTPTVNFCCNCHKCAFTYLIARGHRTPEFLEKFFSRDMLEDVMLFRPLMDFVGEKPLDCVGDKKEVWVALNVLREQGNQSAVVKYFEQNIFPQIKDEIPSFQEEIFAIQQVPVTTPEYLTRLISQAISRPGGGEI